MVDLLTFLKKEKAKRKLREKKRADRILVEKIIREIFEKFAVFETQQSLLKEVKEKLKKIDKNLTIGPKRLRKILYEMKIVKIKVKLKKGKVKTLKCPICGSDFEKLETINLKNEKVVIGYRCPKCKFKIKKGGYVPFKYTFVKITR